MSILVRNMEMPKSCYSCNFCQYYAEPNQGCYCVALLADLHRTDFVKERLPNCPLIEVPKHGKWISMMGHSICSVCGYKGSPILTNYCPNCGARMVDDDV